jgi:hypothetical protein
VSMQLMKDLHNFSMVDGRKIAQTLIQELTEKNLPPHSANTFAFLLVDGMSMREEVVASALHSGLQDIPLFGGSAGVYPGDQTTLKTYLYFEGEFLTNCAILTLIHTTQPFMVFKTENFVPTDIKMVITEANPELRKVNEINGDPAALEYTRLVGAEQGAELYPISAVHPVGVLMGGQLYLRAVGWTNPDQSITFACAIDEGVILTLGEEVDFIQNLGEQFDRIRAQIGEPELIIACDCFSRLLAIERKDIKARASDLVVANNVIGFSTYGEQYNAMHMNQTLTGVAIGRMLPD